MYPIASQEDPADCGVLQGSILWHLRFTLLADPTLEFAEMSLLCEQRQNL